MTDEAFIITANRTPIGSMNGALASVPAPELGALCIRKAIADAGIEAAEIDEVIMGNVVSAGIGQNPARQAAIKAGLPASVGATTVNKVCGSGLKAVMLATQAIRLGDAELIVAGGTENMSRAPYLLPGARQGLRMGNTTLVDAMVHDGLWDVYSDKHMGTYGDQCAAKYGFSRQDQDDFAVRSYTRAQSAIAQGVFDDEVLPVEVTVKRRATTVATDEEPARFDEQKLRSLRPAFAPQGTVTAGNASSINDGAAALLLASGSRCEHLALSPTARVVGMASFSGNRNGSLWRPSVPSNDSWLLWIGPLRISTSSKSTKRLPR